MAGIDDLIAPAKNQLERIKSLCSRTGFRFATLPEQVFGVGLAVGFSPVDYVVLSVMGGGSESKLMITSGVLKNVKQDRLAALNACNSFTSGNSIFPVFLHDAEIGWSLLMQVTCLVEVFLEVPDFFGNVVQTMPQLTTEYREKIAEKWDIGGEPWEWNDEDHKALLISSML